MRIDILTLFPESIDRFTDESIIGRAKKSGAIQIYSHNIRDYTENKHRRVDDTRCGGGRGLVMMAQPVYDAVVAVTSLSPIKPRIIYLTPQGQVFNQRKAAELSLCERLLLLCGHYEGIDERVIDEIDPEEISIGDYVLTGGELAALVVTDAVARLCTGVLPCDECFEEESHYNGLLEYPQYTKPYEWRGRTVPDVLMSGHHKNIEEWRHQQSIEITKRKRPDLLI